MLYLCFGGTRVHVVVENELLRLGCVLRGLLCFTYVLAVPGYMLWSKMNYLGSVAFCGVCCVLPMFWRYLGTCCGQKGITWVGLCLQGLLPFTYVLVVPRYMLRLKRVYLS